MVEPARWDDVEVVTLAFRGSLVDGGRPLRRRLERHEAAHVAPDGRFAAAFEALARERGYRWACTGAAALQRVVASCRAYADVAPALERAMRAGLPVIALGDADAAAVHAVLRPLDGAIRDVVTEHQLGGSRDPRAALACALRRAGIPPARAVHVATGREQLLAASSLGVRAAWLNRTAAPPHPELAFTTEVRSQHALVDLAGRPALAAG